MVPSAASPPQFQSTHPLGVRRDKPIIRGVYYSFNPRTHEGCDIMAIVYVWLLYVSIHAPTRGATFGLTTARVGRKFQSTHPRGVRRLAAGGEVVELVVSIHAPTRGATCRWRTANARARSFNPRTHEGCDQASATSGHNSLSFNPRTHEGCDRIFNKYLNITLQKYMFCERWQN